MLTHLLFLLALASPGPISAVSDTTKAKPPATRPAEPTPAREPKPAAKAPPKSGAKVPGDPVLKRRSRPD
jgi:hypothetical protein